ncbi:MAG TPA: DUF4249 domain-containing protein [Bacteroidales bacterium]|nr:DUF4249 domain-containing protein [Bacteroidales bacterium]
MNAIVKIKRFVCQCGMFFMLIISISSCQEAYTDDDTTNDKKVLVVNGEITDKPGPYKVTLTYASDFGSDKVTYVSGATVFLHDDKGKNVPMTEKTRGVYSTDSAAIQGTVGRTYYLYIKLLDKTLYESKKQKLVDRDYTDSIYAEYGTYDYTATGTDGNIIKKTLEGIYVYVDIKSNSPETKCFYFSKKVVWQYTRSLNIPGQMPQPMYFRQVINADNLPDAKATQLYNGMQVIKKHLLFFVPYNVDNTNGIDSLNWGPYSSQGWVSYVFISGITKEAYKFYNDAAAQLSSGMQLFDPIPSQVNSNVYCKSDSTIPVLGLFKVYTQKNKYKAFMWYPTLKHVIEKDVIDPGPLVNDTFISRPQPYWVFFN